MTRMVADASVIVKWLFPQRDGERDVDQALSLLEGFKAGRVTLHQPIHWLAEVAAVLVRLSPSIASADIADLYVMNIPSSRADSQLQRRGPIGACRARTAPCIDERIPRFETLSSL